MSPRSKQGLRKVAMSQKASKEPGSQVQLRNSETSTTDLLGSKQAPGSHLGGKAHTLLVEVLDG